MSVIFSTDDILSINQIKNTNYLGVRALQKVVRSGLNESITTLVVKQPLAKPGDLLNTSWLNNTK